MRRVAVCAAAKLNLGLEVLRRRDDGYHEIRTILQTVSVFDDLDLRPAPDVRIDPPLPGVSYEENLAARAAALLQRETGVQAGVSIRITKRIAAAAGLGGASSDAAATLRAAALLWEVDPPLERMHDLAAQLGSDVPFFLTGGTALATGRGEVVQPLTPIEDVWFVVAVPRLAIPSKTASMYRLLIPEDFSDGRAVSALAADIRQGAFRADSLLPNAFTRALYREAPALRELQEAFRAAGARAIALTGAGPAHFTVVADPERASSIANRLAERLGKSASVLVCSPVACAPEPRVMLDCPARPN